MRKFFDSYYSQFDCQFDSQFDSQLSPATTGGSRLLCSFVAKMIANFRAYDYTTYINLELFIGPLSFVYIEKSRKYVCTLIEYLPTIVIQDLAVLRKKTRF